MWDSNDLLYDLVVNVTDPVNGEIVLSIPQTITDNKLPTDEGKWDLILISPSGDRIGPVAGGAAMIRDPVTQFA